MPAGTYSDDTQLRLATCRAIRDDGEFDVDSFARVELVAWQAYHLGAGRGSKAAAAGMSRSEARWSQNTFATRDVRYVEVGGNGAAMRIQPHVWAARSLTDPTRVLPGVLRDAVSTHGHPVGIVGAVFHAVCLMLTLDQGAVPSPGQWPLLGKMTSTLLDVIASDDELNGLWRPAWEVAARRPLIPALKETLGDLEAQLARVAALLKARNGGPQDEYLAVLEAVDGFEQATRGSGIGTTVAALALAAAAEDPGDALRMAANTLGSDTDTIATMAGALMGAVIADHPPTPFQDSRYVDREAYRLHAVATGSGSPVPPFRYPDLFRWNPPRTGLDLVGLAEGQLALAGLGALSELGPAIHGGGARTPTTFQWMELPFGQRVLVRFRPDPKPLPAGLQAAGPWTAPPTTGAAQSATRQERLPFDRAPQPQKAQPPRLGVDEAIAAARASRYDPQRVGALLKQLIEADPPQAVERAAAFAAVMAADLTGRR